MSLRIKRKSGQDISCPELCCELKKTRSIVYSRHNNSATMYQGSYDFQLIRLRWISLTYDSHIRAIARNGIGTAAEPYYEITCQPICPANVYLHNVSQIRAIVIRLFTTACLIGHSMHLPLSLLFPGYTYMREFGMSPADDRTRYLCETIQQFRYTRRQSRRRQSIFERMNYSYVGDNAARQTRAIVAGTR